LDPIVFAAVLAAALLHASWNAIVRTGLDRFSAILLLVLFQSAIGAVLLPFFAFPAPAAWPWVALSALLHIGYNVCLIRAYEHGELSQVYPLARGSAPLIVALAGTFLLGETMTPAGVLAVLAIGLGVLTMSLRGAMTREALAYAAATAACTAGYTLTDAVGARASEAVSGYTLLLFALDGPMIVVFALASRGRAAFAGLAPAWRSGLAAGAMSLASYWVAIWAFTQAPVALVAALRETSVLFAMLIAVLVLKEPAGRWRWTAAGLICGGMALLRV
jgi:drug/metabolite transporter (DMT)-like permease